MQKNKSNQSRISSVNKEFQQLVDENRISEAINLLYKNQSENWPLLKQSLENLTLDKTKKFFFDGYEIRMQFNHGRIVSTTADVSVEAIKKRECFLCIENLPKEEQSVLYDNKYLVLCNPYPIFPGHLTCSNIEHIPQRIKNNFVNLIRISKDLPEITFLYNGPEAGASAPDHHHFQACRKNSFPIENDFDGLKNEYGTELISDEDLSVFAVDDGIRKFISIESLSHEITVKTFNDFYEAYSQISKGNLEPKMNIVSSYYEESGWRVIIFLRDKHRPDAYFKKDDENILVSPASIDLGGVLITPLEKDFMKIDKDMIKQIYSEVSLGKEGFDFLKMKLKKKWKHLYLK
jgi:Domain of unknown function (DUF4922)